MVRGEAREPSATAAGPKARVGSDEAGDTDVAAGTARSTWRDRAPKIVALLAIYGVVLAAGSYLGHMFSAQLNTETWADSTMMTKIIITGTLVYMALMALPFVPGVEIGMALILAFGAKVVPIVYLATICSLTLSFCAGRVVPQAWLAAAFRRLRLAKAEAMVLRFAPLTPAERVEAIMASAPRRWVPWLLKHRMWALAVLINLPGSGLIGGGGGIAMAIGLSRLLSIPKFVLAVALGAAPVPLIVFLADRLEMRYSL